MGLLKLFSKPASAPARLPSGSFTVDRDGDILVSTLPQTFSVTLTREIDEAVELLPAFDVVIHLLDELIQFFAGHRRMGTGFRWWGPSESGARGIQSPHLSGRER